MDTEQLKEVIKEYLKDNLRIGVEKRQDFDDTIHVIIAVYLEGEEISTDWFTL